MAGERDFFDISVVRALTMEVHARRLEVVATTISYAQADYESLDPSSGLVSDNAKARIAYAEACVRLVNAMHDYWPEFFSHDVPF